MSGSSADVIPRDALLADVRRAVANTHPDGADALVQAIEYLTSTDPRPRVARTAPLPARVRTWVPVEAVLNAVNDVECADPRGPRLFWQAGTSQVVDAGLTMFSLRADPVNVATRSLWRAEAVRIAFPEDVPHLFGRESANAPPMPPRAAALLQRMSSWSADEPIDPAAVLLGLFDEGRRAAQRGWSGSAAWQAFREVTASLREAFSARAEAMIDALWLLATARTAEPARADATASDIGSTPRELALQMTALLNEAERWQPDAIRRTWSAAPGPGGAVEIRSVPARV